MDENLVKKPKPCCMCSNKFDSDSLAPFGWGYICEVCFNVIMMKNEEGR